MRAPLAVTWLPAPDIRAVPPQGPAPACPAGAPACRGAGRQDPPRLHFLRAFGGKHPYMRGYEFS